MSGQDSGSTGQEVTGIRQYRHDMKNHLLCILVLLRNERITEAMRYIEELESGIKTSAEGSGENLVLHKLMEEKLREAKKQNVEVACRIGIGRDLQVRDIDWSILLGNALDNALEALEKVAEEERRLWISLREEKGMLAGTIRNTMSAKVKKQAGAYETTKKDKAGHGMGIAQMRKVAARYEGSLEIVEDGKTFEVIFLLQNV